MSCIDYRITVADAAAHRFAVTLRIPRPAPHTTVSLPVWIAGSYMVRDFSRHLSRLRARQGARTVPLEQIDKTTWRAFCHGQAALQVDYEVYAFDPSVRGAFLDAERGFFNATSVCLRVHGREAEPHEIRLLGLPALWQTATSMPPAGGKNRFVSADYDELADHPFELGRFWRGHFEAGDTAHEVVVSGAWPTFDGARLLADAQRLCAAHIRFWHGRGRPPFGRYVFLLHATDDGYGGLEHRASTALTGRRADLPRQGQTAASDGYIALLGLISHEYFHAWNVKRLKPAEFEHYDYARENYTEMLWFFEGFTAYYDDLMLLRAGLIDAPRYLKLLARPIDIVRATPGRQVQSAAEASFDAWVKYYRSDENTPNATVSYYAKGALIALLLDARLRGAGTSLDALMHRLWRTCPGGILTEARLLDEVQSLSDIDLRQDLTRWVHGRDELPLCETLQAIGVDLHARPAGLAVRLGLRMNEGASGGRVVKSVLDGGAAARAGLAAGDEVLAVNGWRIEQLDDAAQWLAPHQTLGQTLEVLVARRQRVLTLAVSPAAKPDAGGTCALTLQTQPSAAAAQMRRGWLGA